MKKIELSKNGKNKGKYFVMVDDEDYDFLMQWNWRVSIDRNINYACRAVRENKKLASFQSMHRLIMCVSDNKIHVDHIDGNGLNNQKSNLRLANNIQNSYNRTKKKNCKSMYKGVYKRVKYFKHSINIRYTATITANRKTICLGRYKTEEEAARAYDEGAKKYHGEFARLNFPT